MKSTVARRCGLILCIACGDDDDDTFYRNEDKVSDVSVCCCVQKSTFLVAGMPIL